MNLGDTWTYDNMKKCIDRLVEYENKEDQEDCVNGFKLLCTAIDGSSAMKKKSFLDYVENSLGKKKALDRSFLGFFHLQTCPYQNKQFSVREEIISPMEKALVKPDTKPDLSYFSHSKRDLKNGDDMAKGFGDFDDDKEPFEFDVKVSHLVKSLFLPYMLCIDDMNGEDEKGILHFWPLAGPEFNHRKINVSESLYQKSTMVTKTKIMNHILMRNAKDCFNCQ